MIVSNATFFLYIRHNRLEPVKQMQADRRMAIAQNKTKMITVAIVDDDVNIRDGLWWLLNNIKGIQCIGAYESWPEAITAFRAQAPDILLLDVSLQKASGLDSIEPMRATFPDMKIIMHSNYDHEDKIMLAKTRGASGYVLKNASAPALHDAILQVYDGGQVWPAGYNSPKHPQRHSGFFSQFMQKARALLQLS